MKIDETALKLEVCPKCGSTNYQKRGTRHRTKYGNVRCATCKDCGTFYYIRMDYIARKHFSERIFNLIIHLSYFGLSTRTIEDILLYLRVKIGKSTIAKWIKEFGDPNYDEIYKQAMEEIEEQKEIGKIKITHRSAYINILKKLFYEKIVNQTALANSMSESTGSLNKLRKYIGELREAGFDIHIKRIGKRTYYYLM